MARPKINYPPVEAILVRADDQRRLVIRVTPSARSEGVFIEKGRVVVKVRAKPQDGEANKTALALLARVLFCAPSDLELLRGATSREKLVQLPEA